MAAAMAGLGRPSDGPEAMLFCDAGSGRAAALAERAGGETAGLAGRAGASAPTRVVLAVKPRRARAAAAEQLGGEAPAVVSVLAGDAGRAAARGLSGRPGDPRRCRTIAVEVRRGVICYAPLEPRRRRDGCAAAGPARRARPPGRAARRADRRGDGDHVAARRPTSRSSPRRSPRPGPRGPRPGAGRRARARDARRHGRAAAAARPGRGPSARSPRPAGRPRPGSRRSSDAGAATPSRTPSTRRWSGCGDDRRAAPSTRGDVADYVAALFLVYPS